MTSLSPRGPFFYFVFVNRQLPGFHSWKGFFVILQDLEVNGYQPTRKGTAEPWTQGSQIWETCSNRLMLPTFAWCCFPLKLLFPENSLKPFFLSVFSTRSCVFPHQNPTLSTATHPKGIHTRPWPSPSQRRQPGLDTTAFLPPWADLY